MRDASSRHRLEVVAVPKGHVDLIDYRLDERSNGIVLVWLRSSYQHVEHHP
jgi:hypothetical protein